MPDNLAPLMQMISSNFEQLHKRLDVIDAKNEQRDMRVNTMDKENKAEIASIRKEVDEAKTTFKAIGWLVSAVASFVGFLAGLAPSIWSAFHKGT